MDKSRDDRHSPENAGSTSGVNNPTQPPKGDTSAPVADSGRVSPEGTPPPLPPRRKQTPDGRDTASKPVSSSGPAYSSLQNLQSKPTTAISLADTSSAAFPEAPKEVSLLGPEERTPSRRLKSKSSRGHFGSDAGDSASLSSFIPGTETPADGSSLFGDLPGITLDMPAWNSAVGFGMKDEDLSLLETDDDDIDFDFEQEFESVGEVGSEGENSDAIVETWKRKRKHFLILSAAGKPIYTRHGDNGLISDYIGIIQTIISFFHEAENPLKSFSAGKSRIVVYSQGPLHLVAISRLVESEAQLRAQLEALYMQILSTLTLPALQHIFSVRPSSDLRRPLQGTESLLSSLADSFTKGSPSTLLSALECLRLRKSHRQVISNTLLKTKVDPLLYGLVVAGGKLVSVVRPKKHSLHPGDLQLIFNMIFEADGIGAGGGENWIPICLPGFNNNGYLYMYVSFWDLHGTEGSDVANKDDSVAIILISADKESFYSLREMRDALVERMGQNGSINVIRTAIEKGRPATTDIVPGTVVRHFLYKSKANVQFTMSSYTPDFTTIIARRRLLSIYHSLHASVHAKHAHVRVEHGVSRSTNSLAWVTPTFELYCVAGPNSNRNALSQSASKIAQWAQQESERIFIIGGAVF